MYLLLLVHVFAHFGDYFLNQKILVTIFWGQQILVAIFWGHGAGPVIDVCIDPSAPGGHGTKKSKYTCN
jgi:hypothetical protein